MTGARRQQIVAAASQASQRGVDVNGKQRGAGARTPLRLGQAGDAFEHEADRIADRVMAMPSGHEIEGGSQRVDGPVVQRHAASAAAAGSTDVPAGVHDALGSPGAALDPSTRAFFEPRFGHDFSRVRVHVDDAAADSVQANAFTAGRHLVFAANRYRPDTLAGRRLLAHELTHVVQQQGNPSLGVQRDAKGKPPDISRFDGVWSNFVLQQAKKMKLSVDHPKVRAAADELTAKHIGPTNYARWKAESHPDTITLEAATEARAAERIAAQQELEEKARVRESMRLPNGQDWSPSAEHAYIIGQAEKSSKRTLSLQKDIADMERDVLKLKTPDGIEGKIYQYGAGVTGMLVSPTAGTASKLMSLPVQRLIQKIKGESGGPTLDSIGAEAISDAETAYQLTSGDLHEIYLETRKHYDAFMAAVSAMNTARNELKNAERLEDRTAALRKFSVARQKLIDSYTAYSMACELAGIPAKAKNLERMINDTAEGVVFALETAATAPLGGGGSKAARAMLKEGEKALEDVGLATGKELAKDTAKSAPRQVAKQARKEAAPVAQEALKDTGVKAGKALDLAEDAAPSPIKAAEQAPVNPSVAKPSIAAEKKVVEQATPVSRYSTPARQRLAVALEEEAANVPQPRSLSSAAAKDASAAKPLAARAPKPGKPSTGASAPKPAAEVPRTPDDEFADFTKMLADEFDATGPITSDKLLQLYRHGSRATVSKYLKRDLMKQAASDGVMTVGGMTRKVDPKKPLEKQVDEFVKSLEGTHSLPQSVGNKLPGEYNAADALVILTEQPTHTAMDQPFKDAFRALRATGQKEATGQWIFEKVADGIRNTPGMSASEKASRVARLEQEMFELGMKAGEKYTVPRILNWWEILAFKAKKALKK